MTINFDNYISIGHTDFHEVKIYCRCLSTFLILDLLHYYLVDLVRPGSNDTESCKRVFLQHLLQLWPDLFLDTPMVKKDKKNNQCWTFLTTNSKPWQEMWVFWDNAWVLETQLIE